MMTRTLRPPLAAWLRAGVSLPALARALRPISRASFVKVMVDASPMLIAASTPHRGRGLVRR